MYSSTGGSLSAKKQKPTSYLVRPKLGAFRSAFSTRPISALSSEKRKKSSNKKFISSPPKMDFRRKPNYADTAYREAVGRLRILMAESYIPAKSRMYNTTRTLRELDSAGEETDNQSIISGTSRISRWGKPYCNYQYQPTTPRKYFYSSLKSRVDNEHVEKITPHNQESSKLENRSSAAPPELMSFIERQEEYIEQLEKESRYCKEELSSLLSKVKEVISENEHLHEKQKSKLIRSVFEHLETETETETELEVVADIKSKKTRILEGPSIVFESRISELEAQLTQAKIDLKKSQEDNETFKKNLTENPYSENFQMNYKKQLDICNNDKEELITKVKTLQNALANLRDKEVSTCDQVKRSLDVAEQAQYEKTAADMEIRRLKDELERQHLKLRDAIADQSRRISDERSAAERRYTQQIEQLTAEVGVQWETTNKLQLEVDKQRRENGDLRRECLQKQGLIDELKKDMQNKIISLQSDIGATGAEKGALEQQISTLNMANERTERQFKQEIARLQAEIQSLRQRLDRADADLIHSRRENIRLTEQVASLEKEINMSAALNDERAKSLTPRSASSGAALALPLAPSLNNKIMETKEKELSSMIEDLETKHAATVAELENMIRSQNQLMEKLSIECQGLTGKLEDSGQKHKEEIRELQTSIAQLNFRLSEAPYTNKEPTHQGITESRSSLNNKQNNSPQPSRQISQEKLPIYASSSSEQLPQQQSEADVLQQQQQQFYEQINPADQQYQNEDGTYMMDPNQQEYQYELDPNQQYEQYDPNSEYPSEYDPNLQFDPNQQQQYEQQQSEYIPEENISVQKNLAQN